MQAENLPPIERGMDICDRNGERLGTVARIYRHDPAVVNMAGGSTRLAQYEVLEVKTGFLGLGRRLYIPNGFIQEVTNGGVLLSRTADEIVHNEELQNKPSYLDDLY